MIAYALIELSPSSVTLCHAVSPTFLSMITYFQSGLTHFCAKSEGYYMAFLICGMYYGL
jgi:biotin transporter BioY